MRRGKIFVEDLWEKLKNPEFAAYFANAQVESAKELLRCRITTNLTINSMEMNKTKKINWEVK